MMVECLAGAVAASASSLYAPDRNVIPEGGAPGRQSAFLFMIKPDAFTLRKHFVEYMKQWTDYYLRVGGGDARLPGQRTADLERKARLRGIALSKLVTSELIRVGARSGVPFVAG
jgi:LDH2 family malate/lactate/ureidoglycolate dehydrogenase